MLSLQSVCRPTDDFYGVDLKCAMTNVLRDFPEENFNNFFQYSFAILSMCSCEADIFWKALLKLAEGSDKSDPCFSQIGDDWDHHISILSMQVMAMVCARDQAIDKNVPNWDSILSARIQCILDAQNDDDGSFGNATSTALAVQALTAANIDPTIWSCNQTVPWLLRQQTNGDFGGIDATAQILPFLYCSNFGSLRNIIINCPECKCNIHRHKRPKWNGGCISALYLRTHVTISLPIERYPLLFSQVLTFLLNFSLLKTRRWKTYVPSYCCRKVDGVGDAANSSLFWL
ncbi:Gastric intrinsic factor [Holothuria leucospilota]|uniref:Gastric intrinsic factor n=1 Tax=Holothuria leucospilota TaxID=206669 RepID=A0A9Q1HA01_HOLLE|nr:Gastric intrinsic factor [Holothuria leucospilota]